MAVAVGQSSGERFAVVRRIERSLQGFELGVSFGRHAPGYPDKVGAASVRVFHWKRAGTASKKWITCW
jgi:hypothetical protein